MFDLVFRSADLVDGTGAPMRMADVAVADGVIAGFGGLGYSLAVEAVARLLEASS